MNRRILIVEDDATLARVLQDNLRIEGFDVACVSDGRKALDAAKALGPDLILLDVTLPGIDGFQLCRSWRAGKGIPVIILTARTQKTDKLRGLALGADDYVTKPFDLEELLARIRAVLRRARPNIEQIALGTVTLNFATLEARNGHVPIELSHREFDVLRYLAERSGTIVHRDDLLRDVWGFVDTPNTRAVDHAISRVRRKIERDPHHPRFIHTVHGDGYSLTLDERQAPDTAGASPSRNAPLDG